MPDRYANGDPSNDRGGKNGGRSVTGFDPVDTGWYHGGDLKGLTGTLHRPAAGPAADPGPRLHGHLGDARRGPADGAGLERRLPRLLGPRLHRRRPAPRQRSRLPRLHRLRAPARAEGDPRRRRQPHRRRDPPRRRQQLRGRRREAVPRLPRQGVRAGPLCRRPTFPCLSAKNMPRQPIVFPADRKRQEARLAERRHEVPRPRRHRLLLVQRRLLRAGRLLRPRRSLHRAACRR